MLTGKGCRTTIAAINRISFGLLSVQRLCSGALLLLAEKRQPFQVSMVILQNEK